MAGYYRLTRKWMDHEVFAQEVYCKRAAWCWLIESAVWKPKAFDAHGSSVVAQRGQFVSTMRHMAKVWGWSKSKVERFLLRLEKWDMIRKETVPKHGTGKTLISICNYAKYQAEPLQSGTAIGIGTGQQRDIKERRESSSKEESPPAVNAKAVIFSQCVSYLVRTGIPDNQARSLLGKWRKECGDGAVIDAVSAAEEKAVSEPLAWIAKALQAHGGPRTSAPPTPKIRADDISNLKGQL
jgi:hypothetical protein